MNQMKRTPERLLLIGYDNFAGIDTVKWGAKNLPNIPDYDTVIISMPHLSKDLLNEINYDYFKNIKNLLIELLASKGKLIILVSPIITIKNPSDDGENISNIEWCPIIFNTPCEKGKSIIPQWFKYKNYLEKLNKWSFYITIPNKCLTTDLTRFFGSTYNTKYNVKLASYLESRHGRQLAGESVVEITNKRQGSYHKDPDFISGDIIFLPLIDGVTSEEALLDILSEEIGYSQKSPIPEWALSINIPAENDLKEKIKSSRKIVTDEEKVIEALQKEVDSLADYRKLFYSSGSELEGVVKKSFELFNTIVTPAKYSEEEYIVNIEDDEILMEVKGVAKSITLGHLRQLNDYLLKYEEDTGKECKGILVGNGWRNLIIDKRDKKDTPIFPDNVINRAKKLGISLLSSISLFDAVLIVLKDKNQIDNVIKSIAETDGVVKIK